jgi:hypothetical protein
LLSRDAMLLEIAQGFDTRTCDLPPGGHAELDGAQVERDGAHVFVTAAEALMIDGVWTPPGVRRLLCAGERVTLPSGEWVQLQRTDPAPPNPTHTHTFARALLEGGSPLSEEGPGLLCLTGLDAGRWYPLEEGPVLIGRGMRAQVQIRDRGVSRRHAELRCEEGAWWLRDLDSPNGTFLNNLPVGEDARLEEGAILELGRSLLRVQNLTPPEPTLGLTPEPGFLGQTFNLSLVGMAGLATAIGLVLAALGATR